jgi:hypothetical protein
MENAKRGRGRPKKIQPKSYKEQAEEIRRRAEAAGVESNFFFITTFERYLKQLSILEEHSDTIKSKETLIEQTYVKGRANIVINPAIRAYNSTTDSANKTVTTLIRIINGFGDEQDDNSEDPLLKIINGG